MLVRKGLVTNEEVLEEVKAVRRELGQKRDQQEERQKKGNQNSAKEHI